MLLASARYAGEVPTASVDCLEGKPQHADQADCDRQQAEAVYEPVAHAATVRLIGLSVHWT